jgi:hypothetical protein
MNNHNNRRKTNIITTTGEKQTQPRTETQKGSMNVMIPEQQDYSMKTQDIERQEMDQSIGQNMSDTLSIEDRTLMQ